MKNHSILEQGRILVNQIWPWLTEYSIVSLTLLTFCFLRVVPTDFKIYFAACVLAALVLWFITKKLTVSIFILLFVTAPFLAPGKYYSFPLIQPYEVRWEVVREKGVIEAYGLVMSDIFCLLAVYLSLKEYFSRHDKQYKLLGKSLSFSKIALGSWILYSLILLMSSAFVSGFPVFSFISALQFSKLVVACIAVLFWIKQGVTARKELCQILIGFLLFTNIFAMNEFAGLLMELGANQENRVTTIEEQNILPRPSSVFTQPNQFAFVNFVLLLTLLLLSTEEKLYSREVRAISLLVGALIVLTQSRAIWLVAALVSLSAIWKWREKIKKKYGEFLYKHRFILVGLVFFSAIFFIAPRIYYTQYSDDSGSLSIRQRMVVEGFSALLNSPWFGFGANTNVEVMLRYSPSGYIQDFPYGVHLGYLQIMLEAGILGAFFFFFPWLELYRRLAREKKVRKMTTKAQVRRFLLGGSICFVFVYYVFQPHTGRIDFFYLGLLMALCIWAFEKGESKKL